MILVIFETSWLFFLVEVTNNPYIFHSKGAVNVLACFQCLGIILVEELGASDKSVSKILFLQAIPYFIGQCSFCI